MPSPSRPLPAIVSVLAAGPLRAELVDRYDLPAPVTCALLARSLNDSYLVDAGARRFVLRVYRAGWRTDAEVAYEIALLRHAAARAVPVIVPIATREGQFVWTAAAPEGPRQAVLFTYAEGERSGDPYPGATYGRVLADLHAALDDFHGPVERTGPAWRPLVEETLTTLRAFGARPDVLEYLAAVARALRRRLDALEASGLDVGACHGDPHGLNAHVDADGRLTLLDFDGCGRGWRAYDLAAFRWWQRTQRKPESLWWDFLAGYGAGRRLGEADLAAVPILVAVRYVALLGVAAASVDHSGMRGWLDDAFFDGRLRALTDWLGQEAPDALALTAPWTCRLP